MAKMVLRAGKVAIKIILPFVILGLIFYSIKMLSPARAQTEPVQSDLADELALAKTYQEQGQYAEAEQIYQGIIERYPLTDYDFESQKQLAILYINTDRTADANTAVEELKSVFSDNPGIAQALYDIADCYGEVQKNYEKSRWLYQYVLANWPDSETAIWSQADIAVCSINLKDELEADAAIKKLLTDFSASENIVIAVYEIANCYSEEHKNYEKARQLCQLAVDNWPDSNDTILARAGVISARIALSNDPNAQEVVDALLKQFSESEFIGEAACSIANSYYNAQNYESARTLYQLSADNWSGNDDAIWAQAGLISANIYLGDDPNVAEAIDVLLERFSENEFIAEVACSIADSCYDVRKYEDARRLYQYSLDNQPAGEYAIWSRAGKIRADIALDNHTTAEGKIDRFIAEFSNHQDFPETISEIEESYYNRVFLVEGLVEEDWLRPVEMWEKVLSADPNFFYNEPDLYYFIAGCYHNLGEYGKALEYFDFTASNWPDKKMGRDAQIMLNEVEQELIMLSK